MKVDSTILSALIGAIVALIAAIISAILTIQGWRVEQRRLRNQQKMEAETEYRRQQIEELYGPLWGLVQQNEAIYGVAKKILPNDGEKVKWNEFKDDDSKVWNFFFENYPSSVILRYFLLIKDFREKSQQFIELFVVKFSSFDRFGEFLLRNN